MERTILKIRVDDKLKPAYANPTDACMDLKADIGEGMGTTIQPGETKIIGSGVRCAIPEGSVMMMFVRSSIGIKKHLCLANGTGIIDAGYRDEIKMALHNFGSEPVTIEHGERVCQFLILPRPEVVLVPAEDRDLEEGDRGGGIGSTGK